MIEAEKMWPEDQEAQALIGEQACETRTQSQGSVCANELLGPEKNVFNPIWQK